MPNFTLTLCAIKYRQPIMNKLLFLLVTLFCWQNSYAKRNAMPYVAFQKNSCNITLHSSEDLIKTYDFLKENPNIKIQIRGHRSNEENEQISILRAQAVKHYFISNGILLKQMELLDLGTKRHYLNENNQLLDKNHSFRGPAMKNNWVVTFLILA
jgi:OmpA family